jgi:hypothetical protein
MKNSSLIFLLILNCTADLPQDTAYAWSVIRELSSPGFKGRGYVEKGDRISADFIAHEFRDIGLSPVSGNSFFREFNVSVNTFPNRVSVKIDGKELQVASDFIIDPSSPPVKGRFGVITTSRNQVDSEAKLANLINRAGNSFIMVDNRNRNDEEPVKARKTDEYIDYLKHAPGINVKGVIIFSDDRLTWGASPVQGIRPVIVMKGSPGLSVSTIDINVDASFIPDYKTRNVIGSLEGTSRSDTLIVITAHYDHLGKMGKMTYFPGANDNASGVAMLLSLAKHYSVNRPRYRMLFIALSAEELGLVGSKAFVADPPVDLKKIRFLVNFDLAGTGDEGIKVVNGSLYKNAFDTLNAKNTRFGLLPKVESRGAACISDHCPFHKKGVPCFYIYTMGGSRAYHDIDDIPGALTLSKFNDYFRLMTAFLDSL